MSAPLPAAIMGRLAAAIDARVTPGAAVEIGTTVGPLWTAAAGRQTYDIDARKVDDETVYDLASLTKVVATTTLAMEAHVSGRLPLDTRVADQWPAFAARPSFSVADLLMHAAGFPAHRPYYREAAGRAAYLSRIAAEPVAYPPQTRGLYSDLGFLLLGWLLEDAGERSLPAQFASFVDEALEGAALGFGIRPHWRGRVAPTSIDRWRGRVIVEQVHDPNAAAVGGAAGHAGLFGTAAGVGCFARWVLASWFGRRSPWRQITPTVVEMFARRAHVAASSRALGWDTMLPTSSCGTRMSPRAIGHAGFTGTSLWIDPERELYVVLLTNRVHPAAAGDAIQALRASLHDATIDEFDGRSRGR